MKPRKTKDIVRVLSQKGFTLEPAKDHHEFYYLMYQGKKHRIYTYLSHGKKEYDSKLMGRVKKQLKFIETSKAEDFFDCPLSYDGYIEMLIKNGELKSSST